MQKFVLIIFIILSLNNRWNSTLQPGQSRVRCITWLHYVELCFTLVLIAFISTVLIGRGFSIFCFHVTIVVGHQKAPFREPFRPPLLWRTSSSESSPSRRKSYSISLITELPQRFWRIFRRRNQEHNPMAPNLVSAVHQKIISSWLEQLFKPSTKDDP